jgi:hypothetical protein
VSVSPTCCRHSGPFHHIYIYTKIISEPSYFVGRPSYKTSYFVGRPILGRLTLAGGGRKGGMLGAE